MEKYDVIIVGAGIAGCGLAYNLTRICPEKKVLIIDKEKIGYNEGYGSRITYEDFIKKYNLHYKHIFEGAKIGNTKGIYLTVKHNFYVVDYRQVCNDFIKRSNSTFRKEEALDNFKNILVTNKNKYNFKFLVDCAGHNSFLTNIKRSKSNRVWIGEVQSYKNRLTKLDNYFYVMAEKEGFIEEIYPRGNNISFGQWIYTDNKNNFARIPILKDNSISPFSRYIKNVPPIKNKKVVVPGKPIFPLTYQNFAFLGDSFGNAFPIVGEGMRFSVESSEILAKAIKKNDLKFYEREWKKKYLKIYLKGLTGKMNIKHRLEIGELLKDRGDLFVKLVRGENFRIPKEIKKKMPIKFKINSLRYYIFLRLKYFIISFLKKEYLF